MKSHLLKDAFEQIFLVNSHTQKLKDGTTQIYSGLAYLEPGLPTEVMLFDGDEPVGAIALPASLTRSINTVVVEPNTVFNFIPYDDSYEKPL